MCRRGMEQVRKKALEGKKERGGIKKEVLVEIRAVLLEKSDLLQND